jgi:hypothetical protein
VEPPVGMADAGGERCVDEPLGARGRPEVVVFPIWQLHELVQRCPDPTRQLAALRVSQAELRAFLPQGTANESPDVLRVVGSQRRSEWAPRGAGLSGGRRIEPDTGGGC